MKSTFLFIALLSSITSIAQLHSGTPVIHNKPQAVPNSSTAEKTAPPQPVNIPPAANPVQPIYPGAEAKSVESKPLITPPITSSGTQPVQKEPLSPIESTNTLRPNRPPRDQASRENRAAAISPAISNGNINTRDNIYTPSKSAINDRRANIVTANKRVTAVSLNVSNKNAATYKRANTATANKRGTVASPNKNNIRAITTAAKYTVNRSEVSSKKASVVTTKKKPAANKYAAAKKPIKKKKPR